MDSRHFFLMKCIGIVLLYARLTVALCYESGSSYTRNTLLVVYIFGLQAWFWGIKEYNEDNCENEYSFISGKSCETIPIVTVPEEIRQTLVTKFSVRKVESRAK